MKTIYLAGGCFWGLQKYFDQIHGVTATQVGYANGASNSATYGDGSGYAEAVRVDYDPAVAPLPSPVITESRRRARTGWPGGSGRCTDTMYCSRSKRLAPMSNTFTSAACCVSPTCRR